MESHILKHAQDRTARFRPNAKLDKLIDQLQQLLSPAQEQANSSFTFPKHPVIAVVGCPRSGTTFLTQVLAATGALCFPSNLLSRFSYAPHIGALIQQMLLNPDYDLGGEFQELQHQTDFSSSIGKTSGPSGVSEFFHFWRRFFPNHDPGFLNDKELELVNISAMRKELASIESVFEKPFMSKAMMIQYNIAFFSSQLPELKIVHVKRDPVFVMQSILESRKKYYNSDQIWWSVKPREYELLKDKDPLTQVAGQVFFTNRSISQQAQDLGADRFLSVDYEDVCQQPRKFVRDLSRNFSLPDIAMDLSRIEEEYACSNKIRLDDSVVKNLKDIYLQFQNRYSNEASL